jgi:hypothetical protein
MVLRVTGGDPAMIHHVRMGEAVDRVPAMTEGQHGRWRHEAKRRERGKHHRQPEA